MSEGGSEEVSEGGTEGGSEEEKKSTEVSKLTGMHTLVKGNLYFNTILVKPPAERICSQIWLYPKLPALKKTPGTSWVKEGVCYQLRRRGRGCPEPLQLSDRHVPRHSEAPVEHPHHTIHYQGVWGVGGGRGRREGKRRERGGEGYDKDVRLRLKSKTLLATKKCSLISCFVKV